MKQTSCLFPVRRERSPVAPNREAELIFRSISITETTIIKMDEANVSYRIVMPRPDKRGVEREDSPGSGVFLGPKV